MDFSARDTTYSTKMQFRQTSQYLVLQNMSLMLQVYFKLQLRKPSRHVFFIILNFGLQIKTKFFKNCQKSLSEQFFCTVQNTIARPLCFSTQQILTQFFIRNITFPCSQHLQIYTKVLKTLGKERRLLIFRSRAFMRKGSLGVTFFSVRPYVCPHGNFIFLGKL